MTKAQCLNCNDIIESKRRHDWVSCRCFQESLQLTSAYIKEQKSLGVPDMLIKINEIQSNGIYLDGGSDYVRVGGNFKHLKLIKPEEETDDAQQN